MTLFICFKVNICIDLPPFLPILSLHGKLKTGSESGNDIGRFFYLSDFVEILFNSLLSFVHSGINVNRLLASVSP